MKKAVVFFMGVLLLFGVWPQILVAAEREELHLSVACPLSGRNSANGRAVKQGVSLYFDKVNEAGGVGGKKVRLHFVDDGDDGDMAKTAAESIAGDGKSLAVIGHESSSCSMAAGEVYARAMIPALSPTSTDVRVTKGNPWYFRMTFNNDFQGEFLAHYIHKVFEERVVSIIHEDLAYGAKLSEVFQGKANELGMSVPHVWPFVVSSEDLDLRLDTIVRELSQAGERAGMLFVALHPAEGKKLIIKLRDAGIENRVLFAAGLSSPSFLSGFEGLPAEGRSPGYYTDGMYAASGVIFDTAGEMAQTFMTAFAKAYGEPANRRAAFAWDAAKVLHRAMEESGVEGQPATLAEDRKRIKGWLARLNSPLRAVEGVTGLTSFNKEGDPHKPITVGLFKNRTLISAPEQLSEVRSMSEIADLEKALAEGRVVRMGDEVLYKTSVVYTGVRLTRLGKIDPKTKTFEADFYIWFRYHGSVAPEDIEFLSAVEPIDLGKPVRIKEGDRMSYRLHQVSGRFFMDDNPRRAALGEHQLTIDFRHNRLPRSNLIYVTDLLGMGDGEGFGQSIEKNRLINPSEGWSVDGGNFCQDISRKESLGHPDHLGVSAGVVDHSRFSVCVQVAKDELRLRGLLPPEIALGLGGIAFGVLVAGFIWGHRYAIFFPIQLVASLVILLCSEVIAFSWLPLAAETRWQGTLTTTFDILWWMIPGAFLVQAMQRFIWNPLEERTRRTIPTLLRRFVAFLIWLLIFFAVVAFVFDQKITSLLATSGIITMIIGLAIQVNIANIFSGIAINLERPFQIGDFIRVNEIPLGKVMDITWRTTRIRTSSNNIINIPNSMASEAVIENYNRPDDLYEICTTIHLAPKHDPKEVEEILMDAMLDIDGVSRAEVLFQFSEWACSYSALFFLKNHGQRQEYQHLVAKTLWEALSKNGIRPVTPIEMGFAQPYQGDEP